jgi:very-short-patch-repair endonuclease
VADSALQLKFVHPDELVAAARDRRGPGRSACLRVAAWADREAHNAFESVLRGTLIDAGITDLVPQLAVALPRFTAHLDLGDAARRIAVEADSFTYHSTREAFSRDCERYDELVAAGWLVLRFTWEQVMFRPAWVVETVLQTRDGRRRLRSA